MNFKRYHVSINLAPPDWAEDFVRRINDTERAYISNNILHVFARAGWEEYDTKYVFKADWKEDTQYTFNLTYRRDSSYSNAPMLRITYTDGTSTKFPDTINDGEWHTIYMTSEANKTIKYLNVWYSSNWLEIKINNFFVYEGTDVKPFEPYSSEVWHDSHYIHNTSTDTITTLPAVLYPTGTTATVGLKGNTVQNGTPTPDTPIMPQGTGERTGNLFDDVIENGFYNDDGVLVPDTTVGHSTTYMPVDGTTYTISGLWTGATGATNFAVYEWDNNKNWLRRSNRQVPASSTLSFTVGSDAAFITLQIKIKRGNIMLNSGSTAIPYEPYGYKIPISCGQQTETVYLGSAQSTRRVKKMVLTGQENWDSATTSYGKCFALTVSNVFPINSSFCTHYKNSGYEGNSRSTARSSLADGDFICVRTFDVIYCRMDSAGNTEGFKTYLQQQYAAGTPITVWYVLATEETGIVNEPLMKIGNYADSISGISIPTTAGANTLDVDTTVAPSEVTASYSGWHPVSAAHERENGAWT